jgi:signal transduction histidine kinase
MKHWSNKPLWLLILLAAYIFLQFIWWSYHLIDLNAELRDMRIAFSSGSEQVQLFEKRYQKQVQMILGEGLVFLVLLGIGIREVARYWKKELALSRRQQNFMLAVTHELKSPLSSVKLAAETMQKRELNPEQKGQMLSAILSEADRLDRLTSKILDSARLGHSEETMQFEKVDLASVVREVVKRLPEEEGRRIVLSISGEPEVAGDASWLSSLVGNLIENALKYSPAGSQVLVDVFADGAAVGLDVRDKGKGIRPEEANLLYAKFYRSGNEATRETKGTGLGLYIAAQVAKMHGATINASNSPDGGALFSVRFRKFAS